MKAKAIILAVCQEYGVSPDDLSRTTSRRGHISTARRGAILRLKLARYSIAQIAGFLKVNYSTVAYHLYPRRREHVKRNVYRFIERQRAAA
jgi:DNA-binding CsgD family transcriptional regulator